MEPGLKDDRHGINWKHVGYPQGQGTCHLDGRIVRDVIRQDLRGQINVPAGFLFVAAPLGTVPADRARYIDFISISGSSPYTANIWVVWQLWAAGKFVMAGTYVEKPLPVRVYFPPETVITFYVGSFNGLGFGVHGYAWASMIEYNAEIDIWEYGNGGNVPNPAANAIPWP